MQGKIGLIFNTTCLPEFGFPIALDAHNPDTVYVIVENPDGRNNVNEHFTVYRTENGGEEWQDLTPRDCRPGS